MHLDSLNNFVTIMNQVFTIYESVNIRCSIVGFYIIQGLNNKKKKKYEKFFDIFHFFKHFYCN